MEADLNSGDVLKIANLTGEDVNYYNLSVASNFCDLTKGRTGQLSNPHSNNAQANSRTVSAECPADGRF